jgi:[ribosomal protein S5]-alanine N-acetyltransferase
MTPMIVRTNFPTCTLRPWRPHDKPALVHHANNRRVWRNLTDMFPHPYTESDADRWLAMAGEVGTGLHLAIDVDGACVGGIGVMAGEGIARYTGDFGYWLGEAMWGRGIATAAARAMVAHLFATTAFERLQAPVFAWNAASMRVLEKVGFVREGVLRHSVFKDGELIDSVMYARLKNP